MGPIKNSLTASLRQVERLGVYAMADRVLELTLSAQQGTQLKSPVLELSTQQLGRCPSPPALVHQGSTPTSIMDQIDGTVVESAPIKLKDENVQVERVVMPEAVVPRMARSMSEPAPSTDASKPLLTSPRSWFSSRAFRASKEKLGRTLSLTSPRTSSAKKENKPRRPVNADADAWYWADAHPNF